MKFKKLMAAVTTGVLAVTSLSLSGLIGFAEVQELMNDTFESGYGALKPDGEPKSYRSPRNKPTTAVLPCTAMTAPPTGVLPAAP